MKIDPTGEVSLPSWEEMKKTVKSWFGMGEKPQTSGSGSLGYQPAKGQAVVNEAATYQGTPYNRAMQPPVKGVGGDCSGTTEKIIKDSVDPSFKRGEDKRSGAAAIAKSPDMKVVPDGVKGAKPGDVYYWKKNASGPFHVAVFFGKGIYKGKEYSDMIWTARSGTKEYSLMPASVFRKNDPPAMVLRDKVVAGE